jgi:hypothetical protein
MSVAVAGAARWRCHAPGAAAVVDRAVTDAGGLGDDDDEVGAVNAPDVTHHAIHYHRGIAIGLLAAPAPRSSRKARPQRCDPGPHAHASQRHARQEAATERPAVEARTGTRVPGVRRSGRISCNVGSAPGVRSYRPSRYRLQPT